MGRQLPDKDRRPSSKRRILNFDVAPLPAHSSPTSLSLSRDIKGKGRAHVPRDPGDGAHDGSFIDMTMLGDGIVAAVYTVPTYIGPNRDLYPLQIDTGSSDSWIAATSCSSAACSSYSGAKYNPSTTNAEDTGDNVSMDYLRGGFSGEVYWDTLEFGSYSIGNQAIAAATSVTDENLSIGFSGLLGLALPLNSQISSDIPPKTGNTPDGAPLVANLFGLGKEFSPTEHFIGLTLERPWSKTIPSRLGIGAHPPDLVPDPSKVAYSSVALYPRGSLFWSLPVTSIIAWVASQPETIPLGRSLANPNSLAPIAILDTGIPIIFVRTDIANALYGAYGISPAANGLYYVLCTMPLNITISLGSSTFPIHPLDLTYISKDVQDPKYCVGAVQAQDGMKGDIVLGAAFLRNVYTVLSFDRSGSKEFPNDRTPTIPSVGLLSLLNITQALAEFNTVRIDQMPLSSGGGGSGGGSPNGSGAGPNKQGGGTGTSNHHGLSVGIAVLIGVLSFFGLCATVFIIRWWLLRRRYGPANTEASAPSTGHEGGDTAVLTTGGGTAPHDKATNSVPRKKSRSMSSQLWGSADEESLRAERWDEWRRGSSYGTGSTASTRVGEWTDPDEWGDLAPDQAGPRAKAASYPPYSPYSNMLVSKMAGTTTEDLTAIRPISEITSETLSRFPTTAGGGRPLLHQRNSSSISWVSPDHQLSQGRSRSPGRAATMPVILDDVAADARPPTPPSPTSTFHDPLLGRKSHMSNRSISPSRTVSTLPPPIPDLIP